MLDYNTKELIRTYHYNTAKEDRYYVKREVINGRTYDKYGVATVISMVVDLWKVYDPSVKLYKFVYVGGVSRQHPNDSQIDLEVGYELAHENAFVNPVFKMEFNAPIETNLVVTMMENYICGLPIEFIRTREEKNILKANKQ
jgi:hypothetical protein